MRVLSIGSGGGVTRAITTVLWSASPYLPADLRVHVGDMSSAAAFGGCAGLHPKPGGAPFVGDVGHIVDVAPENASTTGSSRPVSYVDDALQTTRENHGYVGETFRLFHDGHPTSNAATATMIRSSARTTTPPFRVVTKVRSRP